MATHLRRDSAPDPVEALLTQAFAPIHKRALGVAVGVTASAGMFLLTLFHLLRPSPQAASIELLAQYFYGYRVSLAGAFIGAWWGGLTGFIAGWFIAFARNLAVATWLRFVKAKAELFGVRDFLDHI
ncbi:MAG: hypothetical protein ABL986_08875 [Vicinamibacterales bacterium]